MPASRPRSDGRRRSNGPATRSSSNATAPSAELRAEFADITVKAAEKVIGQSLDQKAHERIIDETLAESKFSGNRTDG
jgi:hypothetical protein